jgi:hypothetical protein
MHAMQFHCEHLVAAADEIVTLTLQWIARTDANRTQSWLVRDQDSLRTVIDNGGVVDSLSPCTERRKTGDR